MTTELPRFILPVSVLFTIRKVVRETPEGMETGVALLGARQNGCRTALYAIGPGPNAIRSPGYFAPDVDYLNREIGRLASSCPRLEWIGTLHVHPFGMPGLSGTDRQTLGKLLGNAGLQLPDFVAGIIQRRGPRFAVYPYVVFRDDTFPWLVPVEIHPDEAEPVKLAEAQVHASSPEVSAAPVPDVPPDAARMHWIRTQFSKLPGHVAASIRRFSKIVRHRRRGSYEQQPK